MGSEPDRLEGIKGLRRQIARARDNWRPGGRVVITLENPDGTASGIAERWVDGVAVDHAVVVFTVDARDRHIIARFGSEKPSAPSVDEEVGARNAAPA